MPEYQIYELDQLGGIANRRFITCQTDDEAFDAARSRLGFAGHADLWQAGRKLGRVGTGTARARSSTGA